MRSKKHLSILVMLLISSLIVHAQYSKDNTESNLNAFSTINGQWRAGNPANNTLGAIYYQGLNFGFDINNYSSITNPIGTNELYFGRWDYSWKGWNKIWHSGNLNNTNTDFSAKKLNSANLLVDVPASNDLIGAINVDISSFGTAENAARSYFLRLRDIGSGPSTAFIINGNGNVGIGLNNPTVRLDVAGTIRANEIKVCVSQGCDFVFEKDYDLMDINKLENFVKTKRHLPEIASEKEMIENGVNMKDFQLKLLQKTEEMTLYIINLNKKIESQNQKIKSLEKKLSKNKS